jgi:hypothetical protein
VSRLAISVALDRLGPADIFQFSDLCHTGHTLAMRSGTGDQGAMVRAGQYPERAALMHQHSDRSGADDRCGAARPQGLMGTTFM